MSYFIWSLQEKSSLRYLDCPGVWSLHVWLMSGGIVWVQHLYIIQQQIRKTVTTRQSGSQTGWQSAPTLSDAWLVSRWSRAVDLLPTAACHLHSFSTLLKHLDPGLSGKRSSEGVYCIMTAQLSTGKQKLTWILTRILFWPQVLHCVSLSFWWCTRKFGLDTNLDCRRASPAWKRCFFIERAVTLAVC